MKSRVVLLLNNFPMTGLIFHLRTQHPKQQTEFIYSITKFYFGVSGQTHMRDFPANTVLFVMHACRGTWCCCFHKCGHAGLFTDDRYGSLTILKTSEEQQKSGTELSCIQTQSKQIWLHQTQHKKRTKKPQSRQIV